MSKPLKIFIGFIVSAVCLWFAFRNFDFSTLVSSIQNAEWVWFIPVVFLYLIGYLLRSFRWKIIFSPLADVPVLTLFSTLTFGLFINNILPARAGEVARAVSVGRLTGVNTGSCLGSIAMERLTDLLGLAMTILVASRLVAPGPHTLMFLSLGGIAAFLLIGLVLRLTHTNKSVIDGMGQTIIGKFLKQLVNVVEGFSVLKKPSKIFWILFLTMIIWLEEGTTIFFLSRAFQLDLTFIQSAALLVSLILGVMIPAAPGYVGTFELFGKTALVKMGFALGSSLSFVVVLHFFYIFMIAVLALPYFILMTSEKK